MAGARSPIVDPDRQIVDLDRRILDVDRQIVDVDRRIVDGGRRSVDGGGEFQRGRGVAAGIDHQFADASWPDGERCAAADGRDTGFQGMFGGWRSGGAEDIHTRGRSVQD